MRIPHRSSSVTARFVAILAVFLLGLQAANAASAGAPSAPAKGARPATVAAAPVKPAPAHDTSSQSAPAASAQAPQPHFTPAATTPPSTKGYKLAPLDKLNIRIAEWQTAQAAFRDWTAISGEYAVGPDGTISLPFIGALQARGKTTDELAAAIGEKMQQSLGLIDQPSASVEIQEYRPIYLSGDVKTPGQYPFQPNLTVLKAVALGGGLMRPTDNGARPEKDFITAKGDFDVLVAQKSQLLAEEARIKAEIAGKKTVDAPPALKDTPDSTQLMSNERGILEVNNRNSELKLKALKDLKTLLTTEIQTLGSKSDTQQKQLNLVQKQLTDVDRLANKGLVENTRVLSLEQQLTDLESRMLDLDTTRLQAKQDINKAEQDQIAFENGRDLDLAKQLRDTQEEIKETDHKMAAQRDLMLEAVLQSAGSLDAMAKPDVTYAIVRQQPDGSTKAITASEDTPVQPGDVVKTTLDLPMPHEG